MNHIVSIIIELFMVTSCLVQMFFIGWFTDSNPFKEVKNGWALNMASVISLVMVLVSTGLLVSTMVNR